MRGHAPSSAPTLESMLHAVRGRRRVAALVYGALLTAAGLILALGAAVAAESLARLEPVGRLFLWGLVGAVACGVGTYGFRTGWASVGALDEIASDIECRYPRFRERLVAGWEFATREVRGSQSLAEAVIGEAAELLTVVDLRPLTDWRPVLRASALAASTMLIIGGAFAFFPATLGAALGRLVSPTARFHAPVPFSIIVEPGETRLARGDTLTVRVGFQGQRPSRATVASRDLDTQVWRRDIMTVPDTGALVWRWPQMRTDAEYQVRAEEIASPVYRVHVVERPAVDRFTGILSYPRYTGMKDDTLAENEGNASALVGTRLSLNIRPNKPVARAAIVFSNGDSLILQSSGPTIRGSWEIDRDYDYRFHLVDEFGFENEDPIIYRLRALEDAYPTVRIVEPGRQTDLGQDMLVALTVEAMDDYGFDRLELRYRGPDSAEKVMPLPLTFVGPGHAQSRYLWDVGGFDLLPEDRITYRAVVYDNDRIRGPKRSETDEYSLRFPSVIEVFAEAQQQQEAQIGGLTEMVRRGREAQQRLEALRRELLKTEDLTWESRQEAQRIADQQRQMNEQIERAAEELKNTLEQLQKHDVLSPETMEKMLRIREMMSELVTPELRQALEQMQSSLRQMVSPDQIQQAMNRLSENRQQFDEQLERMLNLLKQAQADQQLDAMTRRLRELARLQEDVVESFLRQPPQSLSDREGAIGEQVEDATGRLREMAEGMRDLKASPTDSLGQIAGFLERNRVAERLGRVGERLGSLDPQDRTGGRQAQRPEAGRLGELLDQAAGAMENTAQSRRDELQQDIARKLDRAAGDFLRLSMMQEGLRNETTSDAASDSAAALGEHQVDLFQATSDVVGQVMAAARETFLVPPDIFQAMGGALTNMQGATSALEQRNPRVAQSFQQSAMASLNQAVLKLRSASREAQSSQSGTGLEQLLQQLAELAQRQQQLNQMADQMGQQGMLSPSDLQALAQMAAEQQALGEAMRQLAEQLMRYRQTLGRLGDLAGEMEDAAENLRQGELGPRLQDRQQRILQRLLDAQRSLRLDKASEQRISRTAEEHSPRDPGALPEDRGERRAFLQEALIEALKANYPPEYRAWIRRYYEQLLARDAGAGPGD